MLASVEVIDLTPDSIDTHRLAEDDEVQSKRPISPQQMDIPPRGKISPKNWHSNSTTPINPMLASVEVIDLTPDPIDTNRLAGGTRDQFRWPQSLQFRTLSRS